MAQPNAANVAQMISPIDAAFISGIHTQTCIETPEEVDEHVRTFLHTQQKLQHI